MYRPTDHGWIEVVCGPMYSGKSEELIRRVKRARIGNLKVQVFKPAIDNRYDDEAVVSHCGDRVGGVAVSSSREILELLEDDTKVVAIDEVQFFDEELIGVVSELANEHRRIICAGLDTDFRGEPFGIMPKLMAISEFVDKITAICMKCGNPATRTQRLINEMPANYEDPIVLIGATESYEARCRNCHQVPREGESYE